MVTLKKPRGPRARRLAPPAILDAAEVVFSRLGIEGATVRAIALQAGCDPALIYYHYANKEALFLALLDRRLPPVAAALARLADAADRRSTKLRIWDALEAFREHLGDDSGFRSLFRGQLIQGSEVIKARMAQHLRPVLGAVQAILQQGVERGELRPDLDPVTSAFFIGRMHMEILDLVPSMGQHLTGLPQVGSLGLVRRAWLEFLWRAIDADPTAAPA